jgi:hypothetical protein
MAEGAWDEEVAGMHDFPEKEEVIEFATLALQLRNFI